MFPTADHLLQRGLKLSHLRFLAALMETGQITQAAERIGIAQPAASRAVRFSPGRRGSRAGFLRPDGPRQAAGLPRQG